MPHKCNINERVRENISARDNIFTDKIQNSHLGDLGVYQMRKIKLCKHSNTREAVLYKRLQKPYPC